MKDLNFKEFKIHIFKSNSVASIFDELGHLRITVFQDWPYLYKGTLEYEKKYLQRYSNAKNSMVAICYKGPQAIGATTAIDLIEEENAFQKPFLEKKISIPDTVYFGESILLKEYRGHGIGQKFMDLRIQFAKELSNKKWAAFCSVIRPNNHPLCPKDYRPLDSFWVKNGFAKVPNMLASYSWKDINEFQETDKKLQFWIKNLKENP